MAEAVVLDASALAALLIGESGSDVVEAALPNALINAVNLAEVLIVLGRRGIDVEAAERIVSSLPLDVVATDASLAKEIARLAAETRSSGLSLGDCVCLATGRVTQLRVLTADRAWAKLDVGVQVTIVR
ncbi:MAG: type II toxin-antitoxin system VapC family toxin [Gemmatimonadaceae bacterium]